MGGDVADESEKDDGEHGRKGMGLSLLGAGIADFFKASDEVGQGGDVEHVDFREWEKGSETISLLSLLREKGRNVRKKKQQKQKIHKILVSGLHFPRIYRGNPLTKIFLMARYYESRSGEEC